MRAFGSVVLLLAASAGLAAADKPMLESAALRVEVDPTDGTARLLDKRAGAIWDLGSPSLVMNDKNAAPVRIIGGVTPGGRTLSYRTDKGLRFQMRLADDARAVEYSFDAIPADVAEVLLLHNSLAIGPGPDSYFAIPIGLGILVSANGDKPSSRRFPSYGGYGNNTGYSMAMAGVVNRGSAILVTWNDPHTAIIADYAIEPQRRLAMSLGLRRASRSARIQPLGRGGYVEIAKAYRPIAKERGFLKTLAEKIEENPEVARFVGAADFKPFVLSRSRRTGAESVRLGFTFEETADLAEHFARDLGIDRAMLILAGWINGGYDNKHPDIMPAAPEAGGNDGLAAASRRVHALGKGWVFGLHDNYQDFYKDAPTWDADYIMKNPDGSLHAGGVWAGGQAYLVCSRRAVDLASRPQNVPLVKALFNPDVYFADTVFAVPLYECFDPKHPLTLADDIRYKLQLSDYLRKQVGLFGSEDGLEWGVPHTDYFEGMLSHRTGFNSGGMAPGDISVPMFEMVFGDAIPMYAHQSDRARFDNPTYILIHILHAEMPVYQFGNHHYWTETAAPQPSRAQLQQPLSTVFAQGGRFPNQTDQFIKNTFEVLSPLVRSTALEPMTDHRFLTADRKVERSRFGSDTSITVNFGQSDFTAGNAILPQWGFVVECPTMTAFYARSYGALKYDEPALFVIRSMDGRPVSSSQKVRIYHGFGDNRVLFRGKVVQVETETVLP